MPNRSKEELEAEEKRFQELFNHAVDKWLEKKYAQFGRWTFGLMGVSIFIGLLQLIAWLHGYHKGPGVPSIKFTE